MPANGSRPDDLQSVDVDRQRREALQEAHLHVADRHVRIDPLVQLRRDAIDDRSLQEDRREGHDQDEQRDDGDRSDQQDPAQSAHACTHGSRGQCYPLECRPPTTTVLRSIHDGEPFPLHDPHALAFFQPRPTDVIITTAPKAGTTWMQQILHQMRTGGDTSFGTIFEVVPGSSGRSRAARGVRRWRSSSPAEPARVQDTLHVRTDAGVGTAKIYPHCPRSARAPRELLPPRERAEEGAPARHAAMSRSPTCKPASNTSCAWARGFGT